MEYGDSLYVDYVLPTSFKEFFLPRTLEEIFLLYNLDLELPSITALS